MKIVSLQGNNIRIATLIFTIIFFSVLKLFVVPFFAAKKYVCFPDHYISQIQLEAIENKINILSQAEYTPLAIISALNSEFSFIKKIELSYFPHLSTVNIKAYKPVCVINNELILTNNNTIVEKSIYCESTLESLPHIKVKNEEAENIFSLLLSFINGLPKNLHLSYNLVLFSRQNVVLMDKSEPQFHVKCCVDQNIRPVTFLHCEMIKKRIFEREKSNKNKNITWVADIRFANQIIVYKEIGGK